MKYDVLVVEDEQTLLKAIVRALARVPTLNPVGASSLAEALAILDREIPDLLLTDIRLEDENGLDLLVELRRRERRIPVVVMTAHQAAFAQELAKHGELTVLEKPIPLSELRRVVEEQLALSQSARQDDPFELSDYLQLAGLGNTSMRFEIELENGKKGRLEVVNGEIWNAWLGDDTAHKALTGMLAVKCRHLSFSRLSQTPSDRQIEGSTNSVLLELAAELDEARRDASESPAPSAPMTPDSLPEIPQPPRPELTSVTQSGRFLQVNEEDVQLCREIVEEVPGSLNARLFTVDGIETASWPADGPAQTARDVLGLFRPPEEGSVSGEVKAAAATSTERIQLCQRVAAHRVLVLSTATTTRQGLAVLTLRRSADGFSRFRSSSPPPAVDSDPLVHELIPELNQATAQAANQVTGNRCCAVVDPAGRVVRGASYPGAPELTGALLGLAVDVVRNSDETMEELTVSAANRHLVLIRIPGTGLLAFLSVEPDVRLATARVALRDALPGLAAAVNR